MAIRRGWRPHRAAAALRAAAHIPPPRPTAVAHTRNGRTETHPRYGRGKGFAGAFNGHLEKWYRQQGIVRIEVHANIDVGGYTWATQGFQFEDQESAVEILDRLRFVVSVFTDRIQSMRDAAQTAAADRARTLRDQARKLEAQIAEAEDILDRADQSRFGDDDYPTSWEISQCGRSHDIGVSDRPWIGKASMLGSDWYGVKWL
ncbi:hypothetical protein QLQ12_21705 [Actinoplanes sp. NEAU-A12]|uniref:Uncharacterized protein n=1 Tax=Actinoplanes sandaracinus TaxID=3045177 RepID=A0ABT6WND6_9ACTN|nr:hypothetical protein [Actinoplanes sandaracinus]MDI6101233.1 hypothetical protein [Actinoplanes sandaracinus]